MATLHASAAARRRTFADVHMELSRDGLDVWEVDLKLLGGTDLLDVSLTDRAIWRQLGLELFLDLWWWRPVGLRAVLGSRLAPGLLRILLRRALRERPCLALASALLLLEAHLEGIDFLLAMLAVSVSISARSSSTRRRKLSTFCSSSAHRHSEGVAAVTAQASPRKSSRHCGLRG